MLSTSVLTPSTSVLTTPTSVLIPSTSVLIPLTSFLTPSTSVLTSNIATSRRLSAPCRLFAVLMKCASVCGTYVTSSPGLTTPKEALSNALSSSKFVLTLPDNVSTLPLTVATSVFVEAMSVAFFSTFSFDTYSLLLLIESIFVGSFRT